MKSSPEVLVLAGGPDRERDVSLRSGAAVAEALLATHAVRIEAIGRLSREDLAAMPGDVIFPMLHGPWGEGGGLQEILDCDGRPYVGSGPAAARLGMDKMATKLIAATIGMSTARAAVVSPGANAVAVEPPFFVKPVHDGSSIGLRMCDHDDAAAAALDGLDPAVAWMAEERVDGRELTVGLIADDSGKTGELIALPLVEIVAAGGVYDFEAKYERTDTRYVVDPQIDDDARIEMMAGAIAIARTIGARHLARVDFILTDAGEPMFLEINTCPGFTSASLLPKAAASTGLTISALCAQLVAIAQRDGAQR